MNRVFWTISLTFEFQVNSISYRIVSYRIVAYKLFGRGRLAVVLYYTEFLSDFFAPEISTMQRASFRTDALA